MPLNACKTDKKDKPKGFSTDYPHFRVSIHKYYHTGYYAACNIIFHQKVKTGTYTPT